MAVLFAALLVALGVVLLIAARNPQPAEPEPAQIISEMEDRLVSPLELCPEYTVGGGALDKFDHFVLKNGMVTVVYRIRQAPREEEHIRWLDDVTDLSLEVRAFAGVMEEFKIMEEERSQRLSDAERESVFAMRVRTRNALFAALEQREQQPLATAN